MKKVMKESDWDNVKWRQLKEGEIIQPGDYVDVCRDGYRDEPIWEKTTLEGFPAPNPYFISHRSYRRIIHVCDECGEETELFWEMNEVDDGSPDGKEYCHECFIDVCEEDESL